jgi:hypothetical protein
MFNEAEQKLLRKKFNTKMSDYRKRDKRNNRICDLKFADCLQLVENVNDCVGCGCKLLFTEYEPWCLHQFTFDRIDESLGHTKSNVRIICYTCNALGLGSPKTKCVKGCHGADI